MCKAAYTLSSDWTRHPHLPQRPKDLLKEKIKPCQNRPRTPSYRKRATCHYPSQIKVTYPFTTSPSPLCQSLLPLPPQSKHPAPCHPTNPPHNLPIHGYILPRPLLSSPPLHSTPPPPTSPLSETPPPTPCYSFASSHSPSSAPAVRECSLH